MADDVTTIHLSNLGTTTPSITKYTGVLITPTFKGDTTPEIENNVIMNILRNFHRVQIPIEKFMQIKAVNGQTYAIVIEVNGKELFAIELI